MPSSTRSIATLIPFIALIAFMVVACAAAPTPTPAPVPTVAVDASGQPILKVINPTATPNLYAGWSVTIAEVGRAKTIGEAGLVPMEAKGVFLILQLQVTNGGQAASTFPLDGLTVTSAAGKMYKLDDTASEHYSLGAKLPDQAASVSPKGTLEVGAVFDIDPSATGFTLKAGGQSIPVKE